MSEVEPQFPRQLLPWQQAQWREILAWRASNRLPHALLLCGARGIGKQHFATAFAQALLCAQPEADGQACQHCSSCRLFVAGSHPDYQSLTPAEEGRAILIDQIRALNGYLALKSHRGGHKVAALWPADRMNTAAANALLKTLEEPAPNTLLMLITSRPSALPATVRSRCQRLSFTPPAPDLAMPWLVERLGAQQEAAQLLALADGAPLRAVTLAHSEVRQHRAAMLEDLEGLQQGRVDPVARSAVWAEWGTADCLEWLFGYIADMIRLQSAPQPPRLKNPDMHGRLQRISKHTELETLYQHLERTLDALRLVSTTQVNAQALLEETLVNWVSDAGKRAARTA